MAEIRKFGLLRHLRGDSTSQILHFRAGQLLRAGRGLAFWFRPFDSSIAEVPLDDRELPLLYHARSSDFQDVIIQGVITFRVTNPETLVGRVDFALDLNTGQYVETPLEKLAGLVSQLAQQFTWDYLAQTDLLEILKSGLSETRHRIHDGLANDDTVAQIGIEVVSVRISEITPEKTVEKALETPARELIQQQADEATFRRRALAVEKERAIQENELQTKIELSRREETLIEQDGTNRRRRAEEEAEATKIEAAAKAERTGIETRAKAEGIELVEQARVEAEKGRMLIYKDFPSGTMFALAARELAGKLNTIEHVNLSPDLLGSLSHLARIGADKLQERVGD